MGKKKKNEKQKNKTITLNIIFIVLTILIIGIIFVLSNNTNKKGNSNGLFTFNTSDFTNITAIGLAEYQASLSYDGKSIIFICSNENEECYDTLKNLNDVGKNNNFNIEYLNILELVDVEKEELSQNLPNFSENEYPYLIILNNEEMTIFNEYLDKNQIEKILKEKEIIK